MPLRTLILAVLAALSAAAPASAREHELDLEGSVVVHWHGDLARGCEDAGLCDVRGTISWEPDDGTLFRTRFDDSWSGYLHSGSGSIARTVRRGAAECIDDAGDGSLILDSEAGRLHFEGPASGSWLDSGRCAGPRGADVAGALPSAAIPPGLNGGDMVDFSGTSRLEAGPFSGEVVSTLTGRLRPRDRADNVLAFNSPSRRGRTRRREHLQVRYRFASLDTRLSIDWWGLPEPHCHVLDACGASGNVVEEIRGGSGELHLLASRRTSRRRTTTGRALRALRAGRMRVEAFGHVEDLGSTTHAGSTRTDGDTCTSTVAGTPPDDEDGYSTGPSLESDSRPSGLAVLILAGSGALRTRCSGPGAEDVLGDSRALVTGVIERADLGRRRVTVSFARTGGWLGTSRQGIHTATGSVVLRRVDLGARVSR